VKCSACSGTLILQSALKSPSFQCTNYSKAKCRVSHSIIVKKLETAILTEIATVLDGIGETAFELNVVRTDNAEENILLNERYLIRLAEKLARAKEAYQDGVDTLDEYKVEKAKLEKQKSDTLSEIARLKNEQPKITQHIISQKVENLIGLLTSSVDMKTKQKAIRSIIQSIVYSKPNESLEIYYFDM